MTNNINNNKSVYFRVRPVKNDGVPTAWNSRVSGQTICANPILQFCDWAIRSIIIIINIIKFFAIIIIIIIITTTTRINSL